MVLSHDLENNRSLNVKKLDSCFTGIEAVVSLDIQCQSLEKIEQPASVFRLT